MLVNECTPPHCGALPCHHSPTRPGLPTCPIYALCAGNGEQSPSGSNEWERIVGWIDFNVQRPNGSGGCGTASWVKCWLHPHPLLDQPQLHT